MAKALYVAGTIFVNIKNEKATFLVRNTKGSHAVRGVTLRYLYDFHSFCYCAETKRFQRIQRILVEPILHRRLVSTTPERYSLDSYFEIFVLTLGGNKEEVKYQEEIFRILRAHAPNKAAPPRRTLQEGYFS